MKTPLFIATRYLLAKKSHNLINIITWISIVGISVASFALIVVLSVFNGLENVISSLNNRLTPDIQISSSVGKTIDLQSFPSEGLLSVQGVDYVVPTLTEDALFRANDKQHIGQVKGVSADYEKIERMKEVVFNQDTLLLSDGDYDFAVPGAGVAWYLGINAYDPYSVVRVYVPKRGNASSMSLENSFNSGVLSVQSVFATEQEMDEKIVLVPFQWLSELLEYEDKATEMELFLSQNADVRKVKKEVKSMLGDGFVIKDQQEQQETLYRIMRSEKWAVYAILTFILILATFNVVGSLSMLMIDKRKDSEILKAMGADRNFLQRVFMNEGLLISVVGGIIGLVIGILAVLLQQHFGFIKFGSGGGNYIVDAYPVLLKMKDVFIIFATILVVGCTSAFLTVRHAMKKEGFSLKAK
ncbi:MAG: FtsX-like permease family protein [Bacteroidales bacterium]|nr:FtsX-like permease family protein [Bacteroidales bacterium]